MRHTGFLLVFIPCLFTAACSTTRPMAEDLSHTAFAQAFHGQKASIRLYDGRVIQTDHLRVEVDSTFYRKHKGGVVVINALPTPDIATIRLRPRRRRSRIQGNVFGGIAAGVALGTVLYLDNRPGASDFKRCSENCIGVALRAGYSKMLVPAGGMLGLISGALLNIRKPRRLTYTLVFEADSVRFRKLDSD